MGFLFIPYRFTAQVHDRVKAFLADPCVLFGGDFYAAKVLGIL